jgi:GT2 family glycosyltransferase
MENNPPSTHNLAVSIVLFHSSVELLRATLASLRTACQHARQAAGLGAVQVIVIDNSQDPAYGQRVLDAISAIDQDNFFALRYLPVPENRGFGAGHNVMIAETDSKYYLVLNPDVELARSALSVGLTTLEGDPGAALVSPKVMGRTGEQEFLCKSYPSVWVLLLRAFAPGFIRKWFQPQLDRYELRDLCTRGEPAEVPLASGCFMLMRWNAFTALNGFNESYFLYFEDFDFSLRLRKQGRSLFLPAMKITHHGGYAASKGLRHIGLFIKSGARFFNDHGWKWI